MADTDTKVDEFFERYASALLTRNEKSIAQMYAIPSLILFPDHSIIVSDAKQTEAFFSSSWNQYEGINEVQKKFSIMGEAPHSVWVDVTWSYGQEQDERFCYQLVEKDNRYQIAVLTPLA